MQAQFKNLGEDVAKIRTEQMMDQLAIFKKSLEEFAQKYKVSDHRNMVWRSSLPFPLFGLRFSSW